MFPKSPSKLSPWKGKGKVIEPDVECDYDDLFPTITYRHLLSHSLGTRDPLRVIALCDSDAFYAACEMVRLGVGPDTPLVVQQWDALIAVNYPARKFGISRMDKLKEAKKRCETLVAVHVATYKEGQEEPGYWGEVDSRTHKVSLDHYRRESAKILASFKADIPNGEVERASIDEAFFDLTRPVREIILQRYPHLAKVPPEGADTPLPPPPAVDWEGLGYIIPVSPDPDTTPQDQNSVTNNDDSGDDGETISSELPMTGSSTTTSESTKNEYPSPISRESPITWHDVALSIGAELMKKIRDNVRVQLGYTTSAGIARNKFLAKLSASYRKPNSQSILRNAVIPSYLKPIRFQKIRFLGGKLGVAIAKEYEVSTVGDLLPISLEELQHKFGENAIWVWEILRGVDRTEVKAKPPQVKSMMASKNLPQPITNFDEAKHWIRVLAAELALRLRDARKENPTIWPKTLVLSAKRGYGETSRSRQAPFPFTKDITVDMIAAAGEKLWKDLVGSAQDNKRKVTHIHLGFSGLEASGGGQASIEGFFKSPAVPKSTTKRYRDQVDSDVDLASDNDELPFIDEAENNEMTDVRNTCNNVDVGQRRTGSEPKELIMHKSQRPSFTCDRCGKIISLVDILVDHSAKEGKAGINASLAKLRMEHDDFHVAQDLARECSGGTRIVPDVTTSNTKFPNSKKKHKKGVSGKDGGIERFFIHR